MSEKENTQTTESNETESKVTTKQEYRMPKLRKLGKIGELTTGMPTFQSPDGAGPGNGTNLYVS
ncbi:MAG: hypothetical protein LGR52_05610 [Candidatus Thiosymbion ectosymbiont of Robbea hypermnestra]|nr:hypothetical protein [Candidatus Thiosymbion ectosymbiont of Robbea hypermnestra]